MKVLQNSFLIQAKARHKITYWLLCIALIITIITSAAGLQVTPFLVYGMYSTPEPVTDTFVTYSLEYDGQVYNTPEIWNYHRKAMFNFTIEQAALLLSSYVVSLTFTAGILFSILKSHLTLQNIFMQRSRSLAKRGMAS